MCKNCFLPELVLFENASIVFFMVEFEKTKMLFSLFGYLVELPTLEAKGSFVPPLFTFGFYFCLVVY